MDGIIPFSADGIRGVAGNFPLNKRGCIVLGKAFGNHIIESNQNPFVMMARDTRPSGSEIHSYIKQVLVSKGIQVLDLGIITTPALAYLVKNSSASLGIMITASHNPIEFNGIKIIGSDGKRLPENELEKQFGLLNDDIDDYTENTYTKPEFGNKLIDKYINEQISQANLVSLNGLRLLVDCANGATSNLIPNALRRLGANVQAINQFNGKNSINLNCGTEYFRNRLSEFTTIIRKNNAEHGISFDGDGDRLIIVDRAGNFYNGDDFLFIIGIIFSQSGNLYKNTIVTTYMANSGLIDSLESYGINVVRTRNGDKYLEEKIFQNNYRLGGEQFGNIMIHDEYHIAADPFYALLYLLKEMKVTELSALAQPLYKYPQSLATINVEKENIDNLLNEQSQMVISRLGVGSRIRVWNSSTQPGLLNIMVEGTRECTYEYVFRETLRLCEMVSTSNNTKPTIIPLSERTY